MTVVAACNHVRLFGVDICDLSLDHHVSRICAGYYRLRQLRRLRRSLDSNSLATLVYVYAVVNSRIDYCNTVLAGVPRTVRNGQVTACVERCCACRYRHFEVWPRPGSDTAWRTSLARRPRPGVFQAGSNSSPVSQRLRVANRQLLAVARYRLNTYGRRAFSVAGPTVWISLTDFIRDPTISADSFRRLLKVPVRSILVHSAR